MFALLLSVALGAAAPPLEPVKASELAARLAGVEARSGGIAKCAVFAHEADRLNGPTLIVAAAACRAGGHMVESSFLSAVGQIRAGADIAHLPPATKVDDQGLIDLYGLLWAGGGVSGIDDEVLRHPEKRARLLMQLADWTPAFNEDYDPGWRARKRPTPAAYKALIAEAKNDLANYLEQTVKLVSDDIYYALHRRWLDVLARNRNGMKGDSADGKLLAELNRQKRERAIALGAEVGPSAESLADADQLAGAGDMPPPIPGLDEKSASSGKDPVAERCLDLAERSAVSNGGKITEVRVTSSSTWGTIWRGDIEGERGPLRFTCTERTSSTLPRDEPGQSMPTLSSER